MIIIWVLMTCIGETMICIGMETMICTGTKNTDMTIITIITIMVIMVIMIIMIIIMTCMTCIICLMTCIICLMTCICHTDMTITGLDTMVCIGTKIPTIILTTIATIATIIELDIKNFDSLNKKS